jgi:hypothetical protein
MIIAEIQADIAAFECDAALYEELHFASRAEAIDTIEFHIIDRIAGLLATADQPAELSTLQRSAQRLKGQLEQVDLRLFQRLRAEIRAGAWRGAALSGLIEQYVGRDAAGDQRQAAIGYDSLDLFINGLLLSTAAPLETREREPEMVYYQQTPARIILELVQRAALSEKDVFYDLGAGLGHVPMLVSLLSAARAKGVEYEPAYCAYARGCAAALGLARVDFVNMDARQADYADGTVFFMYTPFTGAILEEVLARLRDEAQTRRLRLFTYGPCTAIVSQQRWLAGGDQQGDPTYSLGVFSSR